MRGSLTQSTSQSNSQLTLLAPLRQLLAADDQRTFLHSPEAPHAWHEPIHYDPCFGVAGLAEFRRGLSARAASESAVLMCHEELTSDRSIRDPICFLNTIESIPSRTRLQVAALHQRMFKESITEWLDKSFPSTIADVAAGLFLSNEAASKVRSLARMARASEIDASRFEKCIRDIPTAARVAAVERAWKVTFADRFGSLTQILEKRCYVERDALQELFKRVGPNDTVTYLVRTLNRDRGAAVDEMKLYNKLIPLSPDVLVAVARGYQQETGQSLLGALRRVLIPALFEALTAHLGITRTEPKRVTPARVTAIPKCWLDYRRSAEAPRYLALGVKELEQCSTRDAIAVTRAIWNMAAFQSLEPTLQVAFSQLCLKLQKPERIMQLFKLIDPDSGERGLARDCSGRTAIENLLALTVLPARWGREGERIITVCEMLTLLNSPVTVYQAHFRTCAAAAIQYRLLVEAPAEFCRIIVGLYGKSGITHLASGLLIAARQDEPEPDATDPRSRVSRQFQSALMDLANGDNLRYRVEDDTHHPFHEEHRSSVGNSLSERSGLGDDQIIHGLEALFGERFVLARRDLLGKEAFEALIDQLPDIQPAIVATRLEGFETSSHAIALTRGEQGSVLVFDSAKQLPVPAAPLNERSRAELKQQIDTLYLPRAWFSRFLS